MSGENFPKVIRLKHLVQRVALSRSSIYERLNPLSPRYDKTFPKPFKLGVGGSVGWLESEVNLWIESKVLEARM